MRKSRFVRGIALLFALITLMQTVTIGSAEAVEPRESYYLTAYDVYPSALGTGQVRFYWDIWGTDYWDLGVKTLEVYESLNGVDWYEVHTFSSSSISGMIAEGKIYYHSYLTYYGIPGRYYKAYATVWGGQGAYGDSRSFWTNSVRG